MVKKLVKLTKVKTLSGTFYFHRETGYKAKYENIIDKGRYVYKLNKKTGKYEKFGTLGKFKTKRATKKSERYVKRVENELYKKAHEEAKPVAERLRKEIDEKHRKDREREEKIIAEREERLKKIRESNKDEDEYEDTYTEENEEVTEESFVDVNDLSNTQIERGTKEYYTKEANVDIDKYHLMYQNFHLIADELLRRGFIGLTEYQDLINKFEVALEQPWSVQRNKVFNMLWNKLKSYYPEEGFKYMDVIGWMF